MKKALFLLAPLGLVLAGCTSYRVSYLDPVPQAVVASPIVTYPHVVASVPLADFDRDGIPDVSDRYPNDPRFR